MDSQILRYGTYQQPEHEGRLGIWFKPSLTVGPLTRSAYTQRKVCVRDLERKCLLRRVC